MGTWESEPTAGMVIVGAGECGTRAALALREAGYDGPVTLVGAERHAPYERPPLSKEAITAAAGPKGIAGADGLAAAGIDFRPGATAAAIDREGRAVILEDGSVLPYARLLLATGARPRPLPLPGADGPNAAMLRSLEDAARIRAALGPGRRLAVVGGGFIGLELAASARRLGTEVAVIEALPRLLTRGVPPEIADVLEARHRDEGVGFVFEARVEAIAPDGVRLADGTVEADLVVIGIGAIPDTALAAACGLALENGVAVDDRLATADPAIFAAGDCCSFLHPMYGRRVRLESWRSAQEQGTLAACNMLGHDAPVTAVPWFWTDQYDLTMQIAGLAEGAVTQVRRPLADGAFVLFHLAADGRLQAASGIGTGNAVAKDIRLAEMMIARGLHPDPAALAAPETNLKRLLAA
jgi:3-phenylpropionate/trans-cinnamate dioxygenase ferredoxin reductase subunit